MGTWLGHAAPGTFFIIFSLWWLIRALRRYYQKSDDYSSRNLTSAGCSIAGRLRRVPLDQCLIIIATSLGVFMEIVTGAENKNGVGMHNWQHVSMYVGFGLAAFVNTLVHFHFQFLPKGAEYLAFLMALAVEMVLFAFHLHGRDLIDQHIHILLVYTIAACILTTGAEFHMPGSINCSIARCYTLLLQGTWFYQIAFSLYSVSKPDTSGYKQDVMNPNDGKNVMVVTLIFAWHIIGCFIGVLILGLLIYCCVSRKVSKQEDDHVTTRLLTHDNTDDENCER